MIATTLNMRGDILDKISITARVLGISRREVIVRYLMRLMRDYHRYRRCFTTVEYQTSDGKREWFCFHIRLREDENEYFVDMRKFCKRSVSRLLALSVEKYFIEMVKTGKSVFFPFLFSHYVLFHEKVEGIYSWRIYWGFPVEALKTLRL